MTSAPLGAPDAVATLARLVSAVTIRHRPQMLAEMLSATVDLLGRQSGRLLVETTAGPVEIATRMGTSVSTESTATPVLRHWDFELTPPGSPVVTDLTSRPPSGPGPSPVRLGHLVIEDREGREMTDTEEHLAASTATVLGALLTQTRALDAAEQMIAQLGTALHSRVVLEQATGMLAQRHGITTDAAFDMLRTTARQRRCTIQHLAREVVTDVATDVVTDPRNPHSA